MNYAQHGWTPLHVAAYNGNVDLVKELITSGADPHARDEKGETPLQKAAQRNHQQVVAFLSRSQ